MRTGVASFTLDYGQCPAWLFERMVRLGKVIVLAIISEYGAEEFIKRLSDPVWFQSLGTIMAFDWNASGLTVVTLAALKEALRGIEQEVGVFMAGGKGKTSKKTPDQIAFWTEKLGFKQNITDKLIYNSKASAKVDSALIQDGFTLYHHTFIFTKKGNWTVVQQGMNTEIKRARRYHWLGESVSSFIEEPHSAISTEAKLDSVLDLTAKSSLKNKNISLELVQDAKSLYRDLKVIHDKDTGEQLRLLDLPKLEFRNHPVEDINFLSPQFKKAVDKAVIAKPDSFESLLMTPGVGPRTIRALSLVSEVIYGAAPSYDDPARYSFGFGGKDATPYPVDRVTYDKALSILEKAVSVARLPYAEKQQAARRIESIYQKI